MASGVTAIAYETVTDPAGTLPLLAPMSKVAGRRLPPISCNVRKAAPDFCSGSSPTGRVSMRPFSIPC
jgi:hypothetical protein